MLYFLATELVPQFGFLNVFTYHTVRAGGALVTGFLLCILMGPKLIERLRVLKYGQTIKEDHVKDLHALHKGKSGTPTMGGIMIIAATLLSLLLWSSLTNRVLLLAVAVFCVMGAVGFLDDYIKIKRKHNDGLSARAKLIGQVLSGGLLGVIVVMYPITYGASYLSASQITNWDKLVEALRSTAVANPTTPLGKFASLIDPEIRERIAGTVLDSDDMQAVLVELNRILELPGIYDPGVWNGVHINGESDSFIKKGMDRLNARELVRFNRLLLEAAAPEFVAKSPRNLQYKVGVPGIKDLFIPLGLLYVPFVILIITGATNGVNLTDGLDGLAAGASVISIGAFTGIAYVVSRADWSGYLFVMHVPEAAELTVFGSALLGTGLGFLWFNAHPAQVFMGDTGSLALGGVIGAMAVLTKQELLLPIVGGLFVLETLSVIIQVGSFKLRKKRVFRMAPLHHHFELKGWSETKVTIRFWIIALMFALMSLATLKLR